MSKLLWLLLALALVSCGQAAAPAAPALATPPAATNTLRPVRTATPQPVLKPPTATAVVSPSAVPAPTAAFAARAAHIGDEALPNPPWSALSGPCVTVQFQLDAPAQSLAVQLELYGADTANLVLVNQAEAARLPTQGATDDYWSQPLTIALSPALAQVGQNELALCAALVDRPAFPGDRDDFQVRDLTVLVDRRGA